MLGGADVTDDWQPWMRGFLFSPALTVGGGTSEVLRNIIAERLLGLPHDHDVEQGLTWEESRTPPNERTGVTRAPYVRRGHAGSSRGLALAVALGELHGHVLDAADEVGAERLHLAGELDGRDPAGHLLEQHVDLHAGEVGAEAVVRAAAAEADVLVR